MSTGNALGLEVDVPGLDVDVSGLDVEVSRLEVVVLRLDVDVTGRASPLPFWVQNDATWVVNDASNRHVFSRRLCVWC